jgi:hypothetical protein
MVCTGQFKNFHNDGHELATKIKISKGEVSDTGYLPIISHITYVQVCRNINAQLLIDDSAENALSCATASPPTRVLLFGDYQWNKRCSNPEDNRDAMSFDRRLEAKGGREFWKEEQLEVPEGAPLERVKDWGEVIQWIQKTGLIRAAS